MSLLYSMRGKLTIVMILMTCIPTLIMGLILSHQAESHVLDQAEDRLAGIVSSADSALAPNLKLMIEQDPNLRLSRLPIEEQHAFIRQSFTLAIKEISVGNPQIIIGFRSSNPDLLITVADGVEIQLPNNDDPRITGPIDAEPQFSRIAINRRYRYHAPVIREGMLIGELFACTPDTEVIHAVTKIRMLTLISLAIALITSWYAARYLAHHFFAHLFSAVQQVAAGATTSPPEFSELAPIYGLLHSLVNERSSLATDLLNVIPTGIILYGDDLRVVFSNNYFAEMIGISNGEMLGMHYDTLTRRIFAPEDLATRLLPAIHAGTTRLARQRQTIISSTGERIPVETVAFPFGTEQKPQGVLCLIQDLRQDEDLAQMRKILSFVNEASPVGMVILDQNGIITEFNPAMTRVCDISRQQAIGQKVERLFPSLSITLDSAREFRNQAISCPCTNWQVEPFCPCSHSGRHLVVDGTVTRDGRGAVTGMILVFRDITQLREMEGQLHEALQQAQFLLEALDVGVIAVDRQARISVFNQVAEGATGLISTEIHGVDISRLALTTDLSRLLLNSLHEGLPQRNQMLAWSVAGDKHEFIIDCSALRNAHGQIAGAMAMFRDITTLRRLQRDIERSDKLSVIGQLAAGTAHEIRNPLTTVRGFLQLLRAKCLEYEWQNEVSYIDLMLSEIDRINHVISEFLVLAKDRPALLKVLNLVGLLTDITAILESEALLRGINIRTELPADPVLILGDSEQLKQVFLNLATNAFQAMETGGHLTIRVRNGAEDRVAVDVIDTGSGIPPEALSKIFDPFFTTKEEGTGLGLAICNRIIHDHHGEIRVESLMGEGTTVTVEIPIRSHQSPATSHQ